MAVKEIRTFEILCDSCGKKIIQGSSDIPYTWAWRYDPHIDTLVDSYSNHEYEVVNWGRKLCCAQCKHKYHLWADVRDLKPEDIRRKSGQNPK